MSVSLLYNAIKTKLETDVPELKHVRLFNNQFDNDNIESAFDYPVAFIEFSSMQYNDDSQGLQKAQIDVTIHIGFKSFEDENTSFWNITNKVFGVLNGYAVNDGNGTTFEPLKRISEIQDIDHDNVFVWQQIYQTEILDVCAFIYGDKQKTTATTIQIIRDLDVDNPVIRTGDGD